MQVFDIAVVEFEHYKVVSSTIGVLAKREDDGQEIFISDFDI